MLLSSVLILFREKCMSEFHLSKNLLRRGLDTTCSPTDLMRYEHSSLKLLPIDIEKTVMLSCIEAAGK